jgi:hypothetical protein
MIKQLCLAFFAMLTGLASSAQNTDTLSAGEQQLLRLAGNAIKNSMQQVMKENGTSKGVKSLVGNTVKEVLRNTAQRSANQLLGNIPLFQNGLSLPGIINQNKDALVRRGKETALNNFRQSLKEAAGTAMMNAVPMMVAQMADFNVEDLVRYANGDSMSLTDVFKNANRNGLVKIVTPVAKNAFKLAGGKKALRKMQKALRKVTGNNDVELNAEAFLSENVVDTFLSTMKEQEAAVKKNPASLLDGILKMIKQ